jgi:hypothetical protein
MTHLCFILSSFNGFCDIFPGAVCHKYIDLRFFHFPQEFPDKQVYPAGEFQSKFLLVGDCHGHDSKKTRQCLCSFRGILFTPQLEMLHYS